MLTLTITNDVKDGSNGNRQKERGKVGVLQHRPPGITASVDVIAIRAQSTRASEVNRRVES